MEPVESGKYLPDWQSRELSEHILSFLVVVVMSGAWHFYYVGPGGFPSVPGVKLNLGDCASPFVVTRTVFHHPS